MAQALAQTDDTVLITSAAGIIQFVNPAFERISGYSLADAIGQSPTLVNSGTHPPEFFADLWRIISAGEVYRGVIINRRRNGEIYHEEIAITPIRDETGRISHFISIGRDVTERAMTNTWLEYQAHYDALTGLPNRGLFLDRLGQALRRCQRESGRVALLFVDLDRFKSINDRFGHNTGDQVLIKVAGRLQSVVRDEDSVARIGGDEFTVILEGLKAAADSGRVAAALVAALEPALEIDDQELEIGASVGIAIYPEDGDSIELLLRRADMAMFHAKDSESGAYAHFRPAMEGGRIEDKSMAMALGGALARDEFEVLYQAIVATGNPRVVGFEALLRWHSPLHGEVAPSRFIPMLESSNGIVAVGKWGLATACRQIMTLTFPDHATPVLAVNLSGRQFRDKNLLADTETILRSSGLDPQRLELEIAESTLLENPHAARHILNALNALGVRLAIDDFGTGYSSLSHLRHFPVNTLKIDRSLVAGLESSADALWMVKTIIHLADSLGIASTGKGVETAAQLALLSGLGCSSLQGYCCNRPGTLRQWQAGQTTATTIPRSRQRYPAGSA